MILLHTTGRILRQLRHDLQLQRIVLSGMLVLTAVGFAGLHGPGTARDPPACAQDTGHGLDTLIGIESAFGGAFNDTITGDNANNSLSGGSAGDDVLNGGLGADTLAGGAGDDDIALSGADVVSGGSGDDVFALDPTDSAPDIAATVDGGTDATAGAPDDAANGNAGDVLDLRDLLRAVAVYAAGGQGALVRLPGAAARQVAGLLPKPKAGA